MAEKKLTDAEKALIAQTQAKTGTGVEDPNGAQGQEPAGAQQEAAGTADNKGQDDDDDDDDDDELFGDGLSQEEKAAGLQKMAAQMSSEDKALVLSTIDPDYAKYQAWKEQQAKDQAEQAKNETDEAKEHAMLTRKHGAGYIKATSYEGTKRTTVFSEKQWEQLSPPKADGTRNGWQKEAKVPEEVTAFLNKKAPNA